jgi:hypothetical protein
VLLDNPLLFDLWFMLLKHFNDRSLMVHRRRAFESEELAVMRERALFLLGDHDRLILNPESIRALTDSGVWRLVIPGSGLKSREISISSV